MEATGLRPCSQLLLVIEPEVGVESKEIRFLGKEQIGLCHLPACRGKGTEGRIQEG